MMNHFKSNEVTVHIYDEDTGDELDFIVNVEWGSNSFLNRVMINVVFLEGGEGVNCFVKNALRQYVEENLDLFFACSDLFFIHSSGELRNEKALGF